jgi:hypothetical protein
MRNIPWLKLLGPEYINIVYAAPGTKANESYGDTKVIYNYNIYFGGLAPATMGKNDTIIDPLFKNPSKDPLVANFIPFKGSYAIDHGIPFAAVTGDFLGTLRPKGAGYDIGAYEYNPNATVVAGPTPANMANQKKRASSFITIGH